MLHRMVLSLAVVTALIGGPAVAAESEGTPPPATESAPPPAQPQKDCHAEEAVS